MQALCRLLKHTSAWATPGSPTAKSSRRCHHDLPLDPQSPARRQRLIRLSSSGSSCSCRLLHPAPPQEHARLLLHAGGKATCSQTCTVCLTCNSTQTTAGTRGMSVAHCQRLSIC